MLGSVYILIGTKIQKRLHKEGCSSWKIVTLQHEAVGTACRVHSLNVVQEESPGSIGCSASQSEGVRKDRIVQKKKTAFYEVWVRRWGKSPPPQW